MFQILIHHQKNQRWVQYDTNSSKTTTLNDFVKEETKYWQVQQKTQA